MEVKYRKLILILLIFFSNFLYAYDLIEHENYIDLKDVSYFQAHKNLSSNKVYKKYLDKEFEKLPKKALSLGFDNKATWLSFSASLFAPTNKDIYFQSRNNLFDSIKMYKLVGNKLEFISQNGYLTPKYLRAQNSASIRFELPLQVNKKEVYFFKIESVHPKFMSFLIANESYLFNNTSEDLLILLFTLGVVFALVLYNLFLYFSSFDKLYLYYVLYIFFTALAMFLAEGHMILVTDSYLSYTQHFIAVIAQLSIITMFLFTSSFFNLKKEYPFYYKLFLYSMIIGIISMFSVNLLEEFKFIGLICLAFFFLSQIYFAFKSYQRGFKPALFFLIATGVALSLFLTYMFFVATPFFEYNFWIFNLINIGIIWDTILLSFAFAYRLKVLEDQKQNSEKMLILQSRQNSIGEMIGSIAHQWRNPLNEIGAITTNLKMKLTFDEQIDSKQLLEATNKVDKVLKYLSNTITTFQSFFQNSNVNEEIDIKQIVYEVLDFNDKALSSNEIKIYLELDEDCIIYGDKNHLVHALVNILLNAKDVFIKREIENRRVNISLKKYEDKIVLTLSDNARGIKLNPIDSIFEPYKSTKGKDGVGLGLFITRQLIQKSLNGTICVKNDVNGACFIIEF